MSELASTAWLGPYSLGTAAAMLRQSGNWSLDGPPKRFDAEDWWFRREFNSPELAEGGPLILGLDGLATVAEVWLNGHLLLQSDNMFVEHRLDVGSHLRERNELVICCRSLDRWLTQRRPRPRWRAPMLDHQQLRWARTTVLGRTPGWSPPAAAVGPWRSVWLEQRHRLSVTATRLHSQLGGGQGTVSVCCRLAAPGDAIESVELLLKRDARTHTLRLDHSANDDTFQGTITVDQPDLWWPHTHGEPALYEASLSVATRSHGESVAVDLGPVGFRTVALDTADGRFAITVNGVQIFCRGACWTPLDVVALRSTAEAYAQALTTVREAGMNMLRVSGTMVYEEPEFLDGCDRQGVLVWQDLMFANVDYPRDDAAFLASVEIELGQQLSRLQAHPCVAVICGNSEVEQQAAMWGVPRDSWEPRLFHADIAQWVESICPGIAYWPSSAHGGGMPHQVDAGSTSYFGVGAYLRPLEDARRSNLRFASECLAFANVPEESALARMPGGLGIRAHHPTWKARSPRDLGAGWDFDDVRDHYLATLFKVDPLALRYSNHERYLKLSRIVTGEVMASALSEWRRGGSSCSGALILFLRDLWAGAGWGLLDDAGVPKACYHYVKRSCQPIAVALSDEGCNGLYAHVWNDPGSALAGSLEIALYRADGICLSRAAAIVQLAAHASQTIPLSSLFETAVDTAGAFRFSEPEHAIVVASLRAESGELLGQAFHGAGAFDARPIADVGLRARARRGDREGWYELCVTSRLHAQAVHFDIAGVIPHDEYFHLAPGGERRVMLKSIRPFGTGTPSGHVIAMNARQTCSIEWAS